MSEEFDFAWGNPYFLLDILKEKCITPMPIYNFSKMSYAPDQGNDLLIQLTQYVIKETTGLDYKHIIITNGATGAINCCLRHFSNTFDHVCTRKYGYPYYDNMISKAGYKRIYIGGKEDREPLVRKLNLFDSPSNPEGIQMALGGDRNTVWDAVYHNKIYNANLQIKPDHRLMVGSYSKLLGVTGARVGFIATNNNLDFKALMQENLMENATISVLSQKFIIDILSFMNLQEFMNYGKNSLDLNRHYFSEIRHIFDNQPVQAKGMFYCVHADKKALQILKKCGINYVDLGDNFIRLSLGQTNEITKKAVGEILKQDRI